MTGAEDALQSYSEQYTKPHAKSSLGQLVKLDEERRSLLGDISQSLRDFIALQKEMHMDDTDRQCRWDLRVVNLEDDLRKIENKKAPLLDNAYKWILDTEQYAAFTRWVPGRGKTGGTGVLL